MGDTRIQKRDWISGLPEPIIHHVFSFLPFKRVAQTCVLSKRWEEVWRTYPVFEICDNFSNFTPFFFHSLEDRITLMNCFEQSLRNHHFNDLINMEKLRIDLLLFGGPKIVSIMDRCISYAIASNVKCLDLHFDLWLFDADRMEGEYLWYDVPPIVLCSKFIEVLALRGDCKLELPSRSKAKLSSLRKLHMSGVYLDDLVISSILAGCPLIEEIIIVECRGFETIELFGHDRLINVNVCGSFEMNIAYCMKLKNLRLQGAVVKDDDWVCNLISELSLLECLCLDRCDKLNKIRISSTSLKTLEIYDCSKLVELKIDSPNLSRFSFRGGMVKVCSNALALSKVDLSLLSKVVDAQWYDKYVELFAQFHNISEMLDLWVSMDEGVVASKELRQMLPFPLSGGKHLKFQTRKLFLSFPMSKVVDELLWVAPHPKTLSIQYYHSPCYSHKTSFEFLYKEPSDYEGESASCCKSFPISCWQRCIETVKLEITDFKGVMKSCSIEGAEFLEKIDGLLQTECLVKAA